MAQAEKRGGSTPGPDYNLTNNTIGHSGTKASMGGHINHNSSHAAASRATPGPGAHMALGAHPLDMGRSGSKCSIKPRFEKGGIHDVANKDTPGPGAFNIPRPASRSSSIGPRLAHGSYVNAAVINKIEGRARDV
jgi:hypothetical protein